MTTVIEEYWRSEPRAYSRLREIALMRGNSGHPSHLDIRIDLGRDGDDRRTLQLLFQGVTDLRIEPTWNIDDLVLFVVESIEDRGLETARYQVEDAEHHVFFWCLDFEFSLKS